MTVSKARAAVLIKENLKQMMWDLQINMWQVTFLWNDMPSDNDAMMDVQILPDYKIARIRMRLSKIDDDKHFLSCLLHELIHVLLGEGDIRDDVVMQFARNDEERHVVNRVVAYGAERMVWAIETALVHGLKYVFPMYRVDDATAPPEGVPFLSINRP